MTNGDSENCIRKRQESPMRETMFLWTTLIIIEVQTNYSSLKFQIETYKESNKKHTKFKQNLTITKAQTIFTNDLMRCGVERGDTSASDDTII